VLTMDARLGYSTDITSANTHHHPVNWTEVARSTEDRPLECSVTKVTILLSSDQWRSWWRSIVVRTSVLAGGLSTSCARLMDGCLTILSVRRPLSVNQQGQLSLPSFRGRLNE